MEGTAAFPRLLRLNFHQNTAETLHIRRLDNGLARPGGRSGENLGHFSSLVVADAFAGALTRGSFKTIPATEETTNTQRFEADSLAGGPGFEPGLTESESPRRVLVCHASRPSFERMRFCVLEHASYGVLGLLLDLPQVTFTAETLGIDLVNILRAGRPRGKPSVLGNHLNSTERKTVPRSGGKLRAHWLAA